MFHTSYSLLWVWMLMDYYDYTGDEELLLSLAPTVHGLLERFEGYRGPSGLLTGAPDYMFMDWVWLGSADLHHPPCAIGQGYLSAFYRRALRHGARLSRLAGEPERAERYERLADEVAAGE